jgi:hypothetical protein
VREYMLRKLKPLGPHVTRTYREAAAAAATTSGLGQRRARSDESEERRGGERWVATRVVVIRTRAAVDGVQSGRGERGASQATRRTRMERVHGWRGGRASELQLGSWGRDNYLSEYQPCSERRGGARVARSSGRDEGARVMCGIRRWRAVIGGRPGRTSAFRNEVEEMGGPLFIKAPTYRRLPSVPSPEPALATSRAAPATPPEQAARLHQRRPACTKHPNQKYNASLPSTFHRPSRPPSHAASVPPR